MNRGEPMNRTLAAVLTLSLAACGGSDDADTQAAADTTAAPPPAQTTAEAPAAPAVTDPQIAAIVVAANDVDIAAGRLAQERGSNAQVKEFAQRMVTDHTGVNKAATDLVTRLNVTPEGNATSQKLSSDGEQTRTRLQGLSGAEFDRAYVDNEVAYHQAVLDAIDQTLIPSAQNAELKALLEQTRPAVAAHLQHAQQIQGTLGGA
jgi:putative membrane protein